MVRAAFLVAPSGNSKILHSPGPEPQGWFLGLLLTVSIWLEQSIWGLTADTAVDHGSHMLFSIRHLRTMGCRLCLSASGPRTTPG